MRILAIETSCDETAAAILTNDAPYPSLLAQTIASSLSLHAKTGGIIPDIAAREQVRYMLPVLKETIDRAAKKKVSDYNNFITSEIDAIAVTTGPGLIGSLLIGIETAKTLAFVCKKPLIPVNHLFGHIYANWLNAKSTEQSVEHEALSSMPYAEVVFPAIALVVSGGHTDLVLMNSHSDIKVIGGTRDDAAGEAFDKIGRLLGLPYPAGSTIAKLAEKGDPKKYVFPRPLIGSPDFDFSFSGLKTAALRETKTIKHWNNETIADFCASVQYAIVDVLVKKTIKAAKAYNASSLLLAGGVAANQRLREQMEHYAKRSELNVTLFVPQKEFCTDNAAMIGAAAFYHAKTVPLHEVTAIPDLYY